MEWFDRGWLSVGVIAGLALLFNIGLLYAMLSGSARTQWEMLRRIAERGRNPWQREEEALRELNIRSSRLRAKAEERADDG